MRMMRNKFRTALVGGLLLILMISNYSDGSTSELKFNENNSLTKLSNIIPNFDTAIVPDTNAELSTRNRTKLFIDNSRAISVNNATSLDLIYYRLITLKTLDPVLGNVSDSTKSYWIDQILSFQNKNGGFGGWLKDTSSISNTYKSIEALNVLNYNLSKLDIPLIQIYIERLRNLLTDGYNSQLSDGDSDISSTYFAVKTYSILGLEPPLKSDVADVFIRAQNLDGGFGKQTNNLKSIYWTSEVSTSFRALEALNILGTSANDESAALTFIQERQTAASSAGEGGFKNSIPAPTSGTSTAYTSTAIQALSNASSSPLNPTVAEDYILSLENTDGSFDSKLTSANPSLKATYFAVVGLDALGKAPTNIMQTINYLVNFEYNSDGYGGFSGEEPTLRETFDAVAALNYMGVGPSNPAGILNFVTSYRNIDGGFGITSKSYVDGTNRVVNIYDILGISYPNPSETISFLQGLQNPDGGFSKHNTNLTSLVVSTYRSVLSLSLLNSEPPNPAKTISYLKATQNADGGFGGFVGDSSDVSSTYRAIRALLILGDNTFDIANSINFLQGSQNPDGGFKRSSLDNVRPKNISQSVYTYAAVRALYLMDSIPENVTGLYYYIESLRNNDGGFGEHPKFTSDNAYVFTSMWILNNFDEISEFSINLPHDLDSQRSGYDNFSISILGSSKMYNYTVKVENTAQLLGSGLLLASGNVSIDTSSLVKGSYNLNIYVFDFTGASINHTILFFVGDVLVSSSSSSSSKSQTTDPPVLDPVIIAIIGITSVVVIALTVVIQSKKKNNP